MGISQEAYEEHLRVNTPNPHTQLIRLIEILEELIDIGNEIGQPYKNFVEQYDKGLWSDVREPERERIRELLEEREQIKNAIK